MRSFPVALPALLANIFVLDVVSAFPNPMTTPGTAANMNTASSKEPCALVSAATAEAQAADPDKLPYVPAQMAYDCLNSVPLGKQQAIDLVDSILPYLEWQSDSPYKANPPPQYEFPGYDMYAALAKVRSNLEADVYANEYAFQSALYNDVFSPGHDGHLYFYPDLLTAVFSWTRPLALVSISKDGSSLPEIKVYQDVISTPQTASVVKLINGQDAAAFLYENANKATGNRDGDSAYNGIFFQQSSHAGGGPLGTLGYFESGGRIGYVYQGANTTMTFENGTQVTLENQAAVKKDLTGVVDGPSFYAKFCNPLHPAVNANSSRHQPPGTTATDARVPGYPDPVVSTKDGIVSGYFLQGEGLDDVAVIAVREFESEDPAEFQAVTRNFHAAALAAGKTKLVVDFQQNPGGYILQGYDFFRQLFPHTLQDGNTRFKETASLLAISEIVSDSVRGLDPATNDSAFWVSYSQSEFNWRFDYNLSDLPFTSFDAKFGPHVYLDTPYNSLMRHDLDNPLVTTNETFGIGIEITGYGSLADAAQPFEADNIVMLFDGVCASTCTLAAEFLRHDAGVRSVAMGGRPREGPIEGVGGVKGGQSSSWTGLNSIVSDILPYAATDRQRAELGRFNLLAINRSTNAGVNLRDEIQKADVGDGLPAQFVKELADCRLYWTLPMVLNITAVWSAAADAAFNGAKCAAGGIARRNVSEGAAQAKRRRNYLDSVSSHLQERDEMPRYSLPPTSNHLWRTTHLMKSVN